MSKSKSERSGRSRRDGGKERFWREAIGQQRCGGESVRAFCRKRRLGEASFYHWRREIRLRDQEARSEVGSSVLAPVVVVDGPLGESKPRPSSESAMPIEIVLGDGTIVRVPSGSTREQLGMVFAVLEPARC